MRKAVTLVAVVMLLATTTIAPTWAKLGDFTVTNPPSDRWAVNGTTFVLEGTAEVPKGYVVEILANDRVIDTAQVTANKAWGTQVELKERAWVTLRLWDSSKPRQLVAQPIKLAIGVGGNEPPLAPATPVTPTRRRVWYREPTVLLCVAITWLLLGALAVSWWKEFHPTLPRDDRILGVLCGLVTIGVVLDRWRQHRAGHRLVEDKPLKPVPVDPAPAMGAVVDPTPPPTEWRPNHRTTLTEVPSATTTPPRPPVVSKSPQRDTMVPTFLRPRGSVETPLSVPAPPPSPTARMAGVPTVDKLPADIQARVDRNGIKPGEESPADTMVSTVLPESGPLVIPKTQRPMAGESPLDNPDTIVSLDGLDGLELGIAGAPADEAPAAVIALEVVVVDHFEERGKEEKKGGGRGRRKK